jgi:nicotinamidase/pyrazinamidase
MNLFWDVDTQRDFIEPTGKLYVLGVEKIRPNIATLTKIGESKSFLSGSVDAHAPNDPEFDEWQEHCIYGTPGQQKIPESLAANTLFIPSTRLSSSQLQEVFDNGDQVIFEKQDIDVRTNPNVKPFIKRIQPDLVFVYGVVTEICVNHAVDLFAHDLGYNTKVVSDAIKELDKSTAEACSFDWKTLGVELVTTDSVERMLK